MRCRLEPSIPLSEKDFTARSQRLLWSRGGTARDAAEAPPYAWQKQPAMPASDWRFA